MQHSLAFPDWYTHRAKEAIPLSLFLNYNSLIQFHSEILCRNSKLISQLVMKLA